MYNKVYKKATTTQKNTEGANFTAARKLTVILNTPVDGTINAVDIEVRLHVVV